MDLDAFDYDLPPERIAQEPPPRREDARLLVVRRAGGPTEDASFGDLPALLSSGDLLVLNDTRVRPARLRGRKESGGAVEVLLLRPLPPSADGEVWSALVRASRLRAGTRLLLPGGMEARALAAGEEETLLLLRPPSGRSVREHLEEWGLPPVPPYIHRPAGDPRERTDRDRYQTVFARADGSAAAPTAGLHFTEGMLAALRTAGVETAFVTLHVGRGTFQPIRAARVEDHRMHPEWCRLPAPTAQAIRRARARGGRVVAVGTTVVRSLEARSGDEGPRPGEGEVDLFVRSGHRFRAVDALLTNFHLPRSSLLVLVAAFLGRERALAAYRDAVARGYRFYSYGDAMLVL